MRDIFDKQYSSDINNILVSIKQRIIETFWGTQNTLDNCYNIINEARAIADELYKNGRVDINPRDYVIDANYTLKINFIKNKISKLREEDRFNNNNNNYNEIVALSMTMQDCIDWKNNYPNEIRIDISELDFGL
jgi:hypothetical protein